MAYIASYILFARAYKKECHNLVPRPSWEKTQGQEDTVIIIAIQTYDLLF